MKPLASVSIPAAWRASRPCSGRGRRPRAGASRRRLAPAGRAHGQHEPPAVGRSAHRRFGLEQDLDTVLLEDVEHCSGHVVVLLGEELRRRAGRRSRGCRSGGTSGRTRARCSRRRGRSDARGRSSSSMIDVESRAGTSSRPSTSGGAGRPPALMKTRSASRRPPVFTGETVRGPGEARLAEDQVEARRSSRRRWLPPRKLSTISCLRCRTAAWSTATSPGPDAVVGRAPGQVGDARARHHRLGGRAAHVDAGAAHVLALDQRVRRPAAASCGRGARRPDRRRSRSRRISGVSSSNLEVGGCPAGCEGKRR